MRTLVALATVAIVILAWGSTSQLATPDVSAISTRAVQTALAPFTQTARAGPMSNDTPEGTSAPPPTATSRPTATATAPPLLAPKEDGHYLINVDIAPGVWRSHGTGNACYWEVTTATGDIISYDLGMAGGAAYIPPTGFEVTFEWCGTWTYLKGPSFYPPAPARRET